MADSDQLQEIFAAALDIESQQNRREYLDRACADNAALRRQVEQLLRAHEEAGSFMRSEDADETIPRTLGSLKALERRSVRSR